MNKRFVWLQILIMINWVALLQRTCNYFIIYMMLGILGISALLSLSHGETIKISRSELPGILISLFFSFFISIDHYFLLEDIPIPDIGDRLPDSFFIVFEKLICIPLFFIGGALCAFYILKWIDRNLISRPLIRHSDSNNIKPVWVFLISFGVTAFTYLVIFYLAYYPGALTSDSFGQVRQVLSGRIKNDSPFYHTQILNMWMRLGFRLFGNINAAVATFIVTSILFVSLCFAYMTLTLYQMDIPLRTVIFVSLIQLILPYNISYSMAVWKEALFGGSVLLLVISLFRYTEGIGSRRWADLAVMTAGSFGMCLFRHNGFYSFILCIILFLIIFRKKYLKICGVMAIIMVVSYILTHPVMTAISSYQLSKPGNAIITEENEKPAADSNTPKPTKASSALPAIPKQQLARVIVDHKSELTEEEKSALSNIMEIEKVEETYVSFFADPISSLVTKSGGNKYFRTHVGEFIKLYVHLGMKYPGSFVTAWIDQTRGYWDGGNWFWAFPANVQDNDLGITNDRGSELAEALIGAYMWYFTNTQILLPIVSIGLYTWLNMTVIYISVRKKNTSLLISAIIPLSIVLILLLCTPVFSENRYDYPVMETMPFMITACLSIRNAGVPEERPA